jgi:hypothetical protein
LCVADGLTTIVHPEMLRPRGGDPMADLIYVALTVVFFASCWGFVRLAEKL